jgi:hypothetical protein
MLAFGAGRNRQVRDPPYQVPPAFGDAPRCDSAQDISLGT